MNNQDMQEMDNMLLRLCLMDKSFPALYGALCNLEKKWQTSSPVKMWVKALAARHKLAKSKRPDLLLPQLFVDLDPHEAVVVEAILLCILCNDRNYYCLPPLLFELGQMLLAHGDTWRIVKEEISESEKQYIQDGHEVSGEHYPSIVVPTKSQQDNSLAHEEE